MANLISLIRTCLCLMVAGLLFIPDTGVYWICFAVTIIAIWMDGLDGYVARKFNETSKAGAVIDILADRIVEQIYWIVFAVLGWVSLWMTLLVIVRGVLVDGLRSLALERGYTAFGQTTMMQSALGILLVSSRFSRWSYAFFKAVAFSFVILAHLPGNPPWQEPVAVIAYTSLYIALFFCIVRGLPVVLESRRFLSDEPGI
jgi:phosphatidylglycerophosphate synthase